MAIAEQIKKGGRYTKKEQEERKIQVYNLHFEENKSAVKIAELLNINRNTINDDIKYWHKQLASEFKAQDLTAKMTKQVQRMEIQRDRLLDDLEEVESLNEKIKLEKSISDIDNRMVQLFSRMILSGKTRLEPTVKLEEIDEDEIKELIRDLILGNEEPYKFDIYFEKQIKSEFIIRRKCDVKYAENVFKKMLELGLTLCQEYLLGSSKDFSRSFDVYRFAELRSYLSKDEFFKIDNIRQKKRDEVEEFERKREEKFTKKYGPRSKWSEEVKDLFDSFEDIE